ncbi:MAG: holo-ACP synthase [Chloroflexota bacterium]|nr:holo-ACP synthase [Chloroflexota bacterium]
MYFVGVDIIEIERIEESLARWGERFLGRVYTDDERAVCRGRVSELAVRFAGKEAVMKALGTGTRGVGWREIEVLSDPYGRPLVFLHGRAQRRAEEMGIAAMDISLSHSREYAVAFVVGGYV